MTHNYILTEHTNIFTGMKKLQNYRLDVNVSDYLLETHGKSTIHFTHRNCPVRIFEGRIATFYAPDFIKVKDCLKEIIEAAKETKKKKNKKVQVEFDVDTRDLVTENIDLEDEGYEKVLVSIHSLVKWIAKGEPGKSEYSTSGKYRDLEVKLTKEFPKTIGYVKETSDGKTYRLVNPDETEMFNIPKTEQKIGRIFKFKDDVSNG